VISSHRLVVFRLDNFPNGLFSFDRKTEVVTAKCLP
jgi:hypothetical protein